MRAHLRDAGLLLAAAAVLRLALFSGFVLGDDPAYAELANVLLHGGYPAVEGLNVFATRPLLLAAIAAGIGLFGWSELAFVLPVLVASLAGIGAAYALGVLLCVRRAGIFAALTIALLPLDLVYATTMANDIVAAALAGVGATLAVAALQHIRPSRARWLGAAGGLLIGLSAGIKLAAVAFGLPLLLALAVAWIGRAAARDRVLAVAAGWAIAHLGLASFFRVQGGSWLAHFAVEWTFNRTHMLTPYAETAVQALLAYPRWMFGLAPVGPVNHPFFPFGLFFPLGLAALLIALGVHGRRLWVLAIWIGALFLFLEFWPLQLTPRYAPIHRLPRFLHPLVLPFAVAIGVAMAEALRRTAPVRVVALLAWTTFAVTSLIGAFAAAARHRDVMLDQRAAAAVTGAYPGRVAADPELLGYLRFRRGFEASDRFVALAATSPSVPDRTLVVTGGSRRVDLDPAYVTQYELPSIPADWVKMAQLPGEAKPWRLAPGVVYLSGTGVTRWAGAPDLSHGCPTGVAWELRDEIDVGNESSERQHAYAIERESWRGSRMLRVPNGDRWRDDGRAFRGSQRFEVRGLAARPACVAILIDARVARQESRWFAGDALVGTLRAPDGTGDDWSVKALVVPAGDIDGGTLRLREEFVASAADINSFLIAVYQAAARR
jgi:4-amino-4-deoxy-L-arabinose transferase-like glycosyltransferase